MLAYLVLKLAEEGIIDLDASIGSFFRVPDFRDTTAVDAITPRIVLSHGTGLSNWRPPREPDRLRFSPGTGFSYSGEAYVRLQRAVVQAARQPFEELVSRRIFTPRRMGNSSFVWRPDFEKSAAEGHDASGRPQRTRLWGASSNAPVPGQESAADGPPIFAIPNAAASLYSTAHDYAAFLATVLAPPAADAGHLSAASLALMRKPERQVSSEIAWALGWGSSTIDGAQHLWHWGNNGVYQAFVTGSPASGSGLVVLTNGANGLRLCREVFSGYLGTEHPAFRWDLVLRQAPR
jgi:CubicO group peptidase (beta-lactamase class C family)